MPRVKAKKRKGFHGMKYWELQRADDRNGPPISHDQTPLSAHQGQGPSTRSDEGTAINPEPSDTPQSLVRLKEMKNMSEEKLVNSDFRKLGHGKIMTQKRRRTSARNLGMDDINVRERKKVELAIGSKIQEFSLLNECLAKAARCSYCNDAQSKLQIFQNSNSRNGLAEDLFIRCSICGVKSNFTTSRKLPGRGGTFQVNRRSVIASQSRQQLAKFCAKMDLPSPVTSKPYNAHLKKTEKAFTKEAGQKMYDAAKRLIEITKKEEPERVHIGPNNEDIAEVGVTVDGTWQKRGHTSKTGAVFLLSVRTGEVLDYEVMSHYCHACIAHEKDDKNSDTYKKWLANHSALCQINHKGSSGDMETQGAIRIFSRSISERGLKYTQFVGDGDSSCFGRVAEMLKKDYGDNYQVVKEECVGHVQKRIGSALEAYKKGMKGKVLSDGKGVGGAGRLTKDMIKRIQNYYGFAIRQNKGKLEEMKTAIMAIKYHIIREDGETLEHQHRFCPKGKDSWCRFWKDKGNGTSEYCDEGRLPMVFLTELAPIFKRLSSSELLARCLLGLTQNQNECLNGTLWSRVPKHKFCGRRRVNIAACEAICVFNTGAATKGMMMERLGIPAGQNMIKALRNEDKVRVKNAARKTSIKYRNRRKQLKFMKKKNKASKEQELAYKAGSFGLGSKPVINSAKRKTKQGKKIDKEDVLKEGRPLKRQRSMLTIEAETITIQFVSDNSVPMVGPVQKRVKCD